MAGAAGPSGAFWRARDGGVDVRLRLTPKSSRDAIDGLTDTADGTALKARVRAVPEDGKANAAAESLLARVLDVPASHVSVVSGQKSRVKTLTVSGDPADLARRLAALAAPDGQGE